MLRHKLTEERPVRPSRLRFGLMSAREIRESSVCHVTRTTLYYRGLPGSGGLLDPLMGSVDRRHLCATCMHDAKTCQGHPGHIELAYPCYHIGFVETVLRILRMTCFFCARACATPDDLGAVRGQHHKARFQAIFYLVRGRKTCPHCGKARPAYTRTQFGVRVDWPTDMQWEDEDERAYCTLPFTAREALSILRSVPDDDLEALGLNVQNAHPAHMILQNMVVPPPCTRPAIYSSEGSRSRGQNELTVHFLEILKRSHELAAYMGETHWNDVVVTAEFTERLNRLQYEIFMLVNSNARIAKPAGMGRGGGNTQLKCLTDRLKGKEGRIRGNLMGKRVDFSARCVITPDAYFDCDRVGVPYRIAMGLTIPEVVNVSNIASLSERVRRGSNDVRGAESVIAVDGTTTSLANCTDPSAIVLQCGDVVERYLADDDIVVFNRQPSLHMHGMQAHRVRLMPGYTFRLSLVVAAPYNADFDGDEMNIHVPQSKCASAECGLLMGVAQNCVSSQSNKPVMGIVQDSLLGLHLLSHKDVLLERRSVCRMIGALRHFRGDLPPPDLTVFRDGRRRTTLWTGKSVASLLFPRALHVDTRALDREREFDDDALPLVVRDGRLLCGVIKKVHVGTSAGGITDVICREFNGVSCLRFMGDAQRLTHVYLLLRGHHVGIDDVLLSRAAHDRINERISKATRLCEEIQRAGIESGPQTSADVESGILRLLSKLLLQTGGIVNEHMSDRNAIRKMVNAGSKGSFINLSQICACLGQQSLEGSRIVAQKGDRTLPFYAHGDLSLGSRGMVFNSFALGLSPTELFYHAIGGREGLVDTAVKTSQTGYLQRRMNKSMEDHTVHADGTIRNAMGEVVAFQWGSDGLHPAKLERQHVALLTEGVDRPEGQLTARETSLALELRREVLSTKTHVLAAEIDLRVLLPFSTERLKRRLRRAPPPATDADRVDPERVWTRVTAASARTTGTLALLDVFRESHVRHLSSAAVDVVLDDALASVDAAACNVGESVGCIAAQSVGEPATQMTLNTFHLAGCAEKNVTLGIPRLKELLDASRTPRTPCTTLRFREPYATSKEFVAYFANTLPVTRLGDVVADVKIVEEPPVLTGTAPSADADAWMMHVESVLRRVDDVEQYSKYVVRVELQKDTMRARHLTPPMIRTILAERLRERAVVSSTEVNSVDWIVRVRFAHVRQMTVEGNLTAEQEAIICHKAMNVLMNTVVVCGHSNVASASAGESKRFDPESGHETTEFVVFAYGNILASCVSFPCVDWTRSTTNDVWEVYSTLGVEACCHVFFDQLKAVVSFDGTYVDDRHLLLIVDTVCRMGTLMPLNRHGINRTDSSPLMRASFEETTDVLCDAAIFAEHENGRGVTTSIMTGQLAEMGTGRVDVMFPNHALRVRQTSLVSKGRVLRSTCRCHDVKEQTEVVEYLIDDVTPGSRGRMSPTSAHGNLRKRARFVPVSPQRAPRK